MSEKSKDFCCVCTRQVEDDAAVLAYGGFGVARLLCSECEKELDIITASEDYDSISAAMNSLGEKMTKNNADDLTVEKMNELLFAAAERAKKIESGEYIPEDENEGLNHADGTDSEGFDEIPEELQETEEDKALDERDKKIQAKFDKVFNIATAVIFAAAIGFVIYRVISGLL